MHPGMVRCSQCMHDDPTQASSYDMRQSEAALLNSSWIR